MKASICGFYGYQNYGDSLMLRQLKDFFLKKNVLPSVFSDRTSLESQDYRSNNLFESDIIALGGGGIITPNFWFFKQGLDKRIEKQSLILLNVGLTTEAIPVFESLGDRIDLLVVRDKFSEELALKYYPDRVVYAPDISYLDYKGQSPKLKVVSVCLNYYIFKNFFSQNRREKIFAEKAIIELASFLDWLNQLGYKINLIACQTDNEVNDNTVNAVLNGFLTTKATWMFDNSNIEDVINSSELLISSRYHTSLFALKAGIPFIDITHHSKNLNFLKDVGLTDFSINYWQLELNALKEKYKKVTNCELLTNISKQYGVYCNEGWNQADSAVSKLLT